MWYVVTCVAMAVLCSWVVLSSAGSSSRRFVLGVLSFRAHRVLDVMSASEVVSAALRWTAFRSLVEDVMERRQDRGAQADERTCASTLLCAMLLGVVLAGICARSALACMVVIAFGLVGLQVCTSARERARKKELAHEMPGIFRTLATAMASGHTLVQAIDYVGLHERGQANEAFVRASLRLRCGWSVNDVLECLRGELEAPGVGLMATALEISQRTGSPLRDLFSRSAMLVEQQGEFERMLAVKTAQVRLSVRIVCLMPPTMVCLLSLISPDYLAGLSMPSGIACLVVAALMDCLAVVLIRKIMGAVL